MRSVTQDTYNSVRRRGLVGSAAEMMDDCSSLSTYFTIFFFDLLPLLPSFPCEMTFTLYFALLLLPAISIFPLTEHYAYRSFSPLYISSPFFLPCFPSLSSSTCH